METKDQLNKRWELIEEMMLNAEGYWRETQELKYTYIYNRLLKWRDSVEYKIQNIDSESYRVVKKRLELIDELLMINQVENDAWFGDLCNALHSNESDNELKAKSNMARCSKIGVRLLKWRYQVEEKINKFYKGI